MSEGNLYFIKGTFLKHLGNIYLNVI